MTSEIKSLKNFGGVAAVLCSRAMLSQCWFNVELIDDTYSMLCQPAITAAVADAAIVLVGFR